MSECGIFQTFSANFCFFLFFKKKTKKLNKFWKCSLITSFQLRTAGKRSKIKGKFKTLYILKSAFYLIFWYSLCH